MLCFRDSRSSKRSLNHKSQFLLRGEREVTYIASNDSSTSERRSNLMIDLIPRPAIQIKSQRPSSENQNKEEKERTQLHY